jgi:hypothetical protein
VLIVGGGIAGLSLDLALRGGQWQVELVEREAGPARLGAGLAVQPNAVRALRGLGVAAAVERAGAAIHRFQYRDQHGTLLCDIDFDDMWGEVGPFVGITRAALHHVLLPDPGRCRTGRSACTAAPLIERTGVATAEEIGVETFAQRLRDDLHVNQAIFAWPMLLGAWATND